MAASSQSMPLSPSQPPQPPHPDAGQHASSPGRDGTGHDGDTNTPRPAAQENADLAEAIVQAMFNTTTEVALLLAADGRVLAMNRAAADSLGLQPGATAGQLITAFLPPSVGESRLARLAEAMRTGQSLQFEDRCQGRWWTHSIRPLARAGDPVDRAVVFSRDITAQRWADAQREAMLAALREAEETTHALFNTPYQSVVILSRDGTVLDANRVATRALGRSLETLIGRHVSDVLPAGAAERSTALFAEVLETRQVLKLEDGGPDRWADHTFVPVTDADGEILHVLVLAQDISDRKRNEARLVYQSVLLACVHEAIIATDETYHVTAWNHGAEELYGWSEAEALGRPVFDLIRKGQLPSTLLDGQQALKSTGVFHREMRQYRRDGQPIWVDGTINLLRDGHGDVIGRVAAYRDITERKEAEARREAALATLSQSEAALRASETKFRSIVEASADGILLVDESGRIVAWNKALAGMTGLEPEQALGRPIEEVALGRFPAFDAAHLHPSVATALRPFFVATERQGENAAPDYRSQRLAGVDLTLQVSFAPILTQCGHMLAGIFSDITERERQTEHWLAAQKLESIGLMAGGIAHDFNNLLTSVLGQTSLARDLLPDGHPVRPHVEKAVYSAEQAARLTRQLLAYAGKGEVQREALDLNAVVHESMALFDLGATREVHTLLELSEEEVPVQADRGQIQQIVMNLVTNAAEALDRWPGTITVRTFRRRVSSDEAGNYWVGGVLPAAGEYAAIQVIDTGIGMDERTMQRVFDPFFSTKATGRGLGLSVVLGIVRSQGGGLAVASRPGRGTALTVLLPCANGGFARELGAASGCQGVDLPAPTVGPAAGRNARQILIIDDEPDVREALGDIFASAGLQALQAASGEDGVRLFREHSREIGLVLLDLVMPGMGGEATLRTLRSLDPNIRVLLSSGYDEDEVLKRLDDQHVCDRPDGFLSKPYDVRTLLQRVKELAPGA